MNDRFWTMKVAVEKVRKFICVMKNEIPLFTEISIFRHNQQATLRVFTRNTFVAVGYNIRRSLCYALFWHRQLKLVRGFKPI